MTTQEFIAKYEVWFSYTRREELKKEMEADLESMFTALNQPPVSGSLQDIHEVIEFLQWAFRKVDKGDTPQETVRMLLMYREIIDNIKFDSNDR